MNLIKAQKAHGLQLQFIHLDTFNSSKFSTLYLPQYEFPHLSKLLQKDVKSLLICHITDSELHKKCPRQ